jgi:phospholipid N-methyltransferase
MDASVYTRPNKPTKTAVKTRQKADITPIEVAKPTFVGADTNCFVTPPDIAKRMVKYLSPESLVLEPSAGTGNLIHALIEYGHPITNILAIERSYEIWKALKTRFFDLPGHNQDFLEYNQKKFDFIITNPPFSRGSAKKHIQKSQSLLNPGGVLIALVPVTLDIGNQLETLPSGAFEATAVSTKLIEYIKP